MRRQIGASEGSSIYIFGLCGGSILGTMLATVLPNVGYFAGMPVMSWITYAITQIAFMLVVVIYSQWRKVDMLYIAKVRKFTNWKQWLLLPLIAIATIIVFLPISNLFLKLLGVMGFEARNPSMPSFDNVGVYFLALFVMALLPSLGEEFLMRGALFNGLSTRGTWFGILISALLFSLMHANPVQTVHQFGLGVVLAIVLLLSGSIWACVFVHFFNNFISITLTAYIPQVTDIYVSLGDWTYLTDFASIIVGAFLLVGLLYLYSCAGQRKKDPYRVATDGVVYEEFSIYATADVKADIRKKRFANSTFVGLFKFLGSIFTKRGWGKITNQLEYKNEAVFLGKNQSMINVWLALGFGGVYWFLALISGFI